MINKTRIEIIQYFSTETSKTFPGYQQGFDFEKD